MFLQKLIPSEFVASIHEIDIHGLQARRIRGVITDLDNTLVEWHRPEATPEVIEWLSTLRQAGIQVTVVSNNNQARVLSFCKPLGIRFIWSARKPSNQAFLQALQEMDTTVADTVVIGDQLFTDVLGGNRLGLHTILVAPVASSDGFWTRFNRGLEKIAFYWMEKKGMISWKTK